MVSYMKGHIFLTLFTHNSYIISVKVRPIIIKTTMIYYYITDGDVYMKERKFRGYAFEEELQIVQKDSFSNVRKTAYIDVDDATIHVDVDKSEFALDKYPMLKKISDLFAHAHKKAEQLYKKQFKP